MANIFESPSKASATHGDFSTRGQNLKGYQSTRGPVYLETQLTGRGTGRRLGGGQSDHGRSTGVSYLRRVRVLLIFCELRVFRNPGIRRSINSKYEDRAGVFWAAWYNVSSRYESV